MKDNYALLITGCIAPSRLTPYLTVTDSKIREEQYIESILFFIRQSNVKNLVFCENSGKECPELLNREAEKRRVNFEWISFTGDVGKCEQLGKGYGEGEITEYAIEHSKILGKTPYFIKITGRLKVKNYRLLVRFMKSSATYFYRNAPDNVDTKMYGMPIQVYKDVFCSLYRNVNDNEGMYLERVFSDAILENNLRIKDFAVMPNFSGVSGSTGQRYDIPWQKRFKATIKGFIRKISWK